MTALNRSLLEYLREKQAKEVAIAGLMTDYCIDATVKCGFEHCAVAFSHVCT